MAKKIRKSAVSFVGWFPSIKNGGKMIFFDSLSTLFRFFFLEFDIDTIRYKSQPFTQKSTAYLDELHSYTPDILVERVTRWLLIECKVKKHINSKHTLQQVTIGQAIADENGWDFLLSVKENLQEGYRLKNYKLIYYYARLGIPYTILEKCKTLLNENPNGMRLQDLAFAISRSSSLEYSPYLYGLIYRRILVIDWDKKISTDSILSLNPSMR